jgi:hypothetical protein
MMTPRTQSKETPKKTDALFKHLSFVGKKTGTCPICKETKQLLFLKYGFTLCEDCLRVCISILEYLQQQENQEAILQQTPEILDQKKTCTAPGFSKTAKKAQKKVKLSNETW